MRTRLLFKYCCVKRFHLLQRNFSQTPWQNRNAVKFSNEVESALNAGKPVVALETTIITHGMPYPDNIETALQVEEIVRSHGATPATIGILNGRIHAGLEQSQLEFLADHKTASIKTSRRDLPYVLSQGLNGGTTVSGTMIAAHMAGISIFVTGGIGGVHRGAESSMDISADLTELGKTPVTVISAGVKSILDIGRTLEYLETEGVNVVTYGNSREFPAFFSRRSGFKAPYNVETALQAAQMIYASQSLGLQTGSLIAVPIPEEFDVLGQEIESVIQSVVEEARQKNIQGKEVTPYILQRVNELTKGKSLEANKHLIKNNAKVGAQIAVELSKLHHGGNGNGTTLGKSVRHTSRRNYSTTTGKFQQGGNTKGAISAKSEGYTSNVHRRNYSTTAGKKVCVVGGSIVDFTARMSAHDFQMNGATYPGSIQQSFGGVGRNIADGLSRLGVETMFISAIGDDSHRNAYEAYCSHMNLECVARLQGHSTATYCAVLKETGHLMFGIGDMDIHAQISPQYISQFEEGLISSSLVCIDGNISVEAIEHVCTLCASHGLPVFFEPTDLYKASKPFLTSAYEAIVYISPNFNELKSIASQLSGQKIPVSISVDEMDCEDVLHECTKLLRTVSTYIPVTMVTIGRHGVVMCYHSNGKEKFPLKGDVIQREGSVSTEYYRTGNLNPNKIVSVSGAGDCMVAAFIWKILERQDPSCCIKAGLLAGQLSLQSSQAVPVTLTPQAMSGEAIQKHIHSSARHIKL